jgi:hypothetical protein
MRRLYTAIAIVMGVLLMLPQLSLAIPAFARKYGFNCNMCHTSFIKLNDFGQRFRNNGYQIPAQEGGEKSVFETAPPISIRTQTGLEYAHTTNRSTLGFNLIGFDFLAAGVMHKDVSFLFIYTPRIDEPAADYTGSDNGRNPSQLATLESANMVFSNIVKDKLNCRVGRFEPAYHDISSKRSYYIMEPYEVYAFQSPAGGYLFNDNQMGIEATGRLKCGFGYAGGVVNGTGSAPDNNKSKDFYGAIYQVFGRGEGQSAGQRIGLFGYYGWQPSAPDSVIGLLPEGNGQSNKGLYRIGGNVSLNWRTVNLRAMILHGADNKALNSLDTTVDYKYTGGFVELDYVTLWNNRLLLSAMYNWVSPPSYDNNNKISAVSALARYYLGDWIAVNVALHAEYTHRQTGKDNPFKEDIFAMLVDFDF